MKESENLKNDSTGLNSAIGSNNEEAKKAIVKERKRAKKEAAKSLDPKDAMILGDYKAGVNMNLNCGS